MKILNSVTHNSGSFDPDFGMEGQATFTLPRGPFNGESQVLKDGSGRIVSVGSILRDDPELTSTVAIVMHTADGHLDETFGDNGVVYTTLTTVADFHFAEFIQQDDKIILFGNAGRQRDKVLFARFSADGKLDPGFGDGGSTVMNIRLYDGIPRVGLTSQNDGKIVVAAQLQLRSSVMLRLTKDGKPDTSFGIDGVLAGLEGAVYHALYFHDDKLIVGGLYQSGSLIARYNLDGTLDTSFGDSNPGFIIIDPDLGGALHSFILDARLQIDGKIIACGQVVRMDPSLYFTTFITRRNADGTQDNSFNDGKIIEVGFAPSSSGGYAVAVNDRDHKILLLANQLGSSVMTLLRYSDTGQLDTDFGNEGKVTLDIGTDSWESLAIEIQKEDGKILLSGSSASGFIARFIG